MLILLYRLLGTSLAQYLKLWKPEHTYFFVKLSSWILLHIPRSARVFTNSSFGQKPHRNILQTYNIHFFSFFEVWRTNSIIIQLGNENI